MFTRIPIPTSVPGINVENMGRCMGGHGGASGTPTFWWLIEASWKSAQLREDMTEAAHDRLLREAIDRLFLGDFGGLASDPSIGSLLPRRRDYGWMCTYMNMVR